MAYDLGTAHGKIELEYTGRKEVDDAERDMDRAGKSAGKTSKEFAKLKKAFSSLGKGLASAAKFGAISIALIQAGAAAGNLTVQILGMVPALVSLLSLSSALPGIFVGVAASVGVLKASFAGVGDAVKAAFNTEDPEAFNEALKKLSPSAREFAKSIQSNAKFLTGFGKGLQEAFFSASHLSEIVPKAANALKTLKPSVSGLASTFGDIARQVANFAVSADSVSFVKKSIDTFKGAVKQASGGIIPLLAGLRSVGTVGLPLITKLGTAVGDVASRFGDWLSAVASDGRLQDWIDTALGTLKTLGTIAKNVGGILQVVFSVAAATGGGLLNTLAGITGALNNFLKSAEGQSAITSLFQGLADVAGALTPVLTTLAGSLISALAPAVSTIATSLGPVLLQVVEALAPAFAPLATAIADVVTAIAPLLVPIATLISLVAGPLGTALSGLAAALGPLISLFADGLNSALQAIMPAFQMLPQFLVPLTALGAQLAQVFAPLIPTFVQLAMVLGQSLVQAMPTLLSAFTQLMPVVLQLAQAFVQWLNSGLNALIPLIPAIVNGMVQMAVGGARFIAVVIQLIKFSVQCGTTFFNLIGALGSLGSKFAAVLGSIGGIAKSAWNAVRAAFTAGVNAAITIAASIVGRARSAINGLISGLTSVAKSAWNAVRNAFTSGVSAAAGVARSIGGKVKAAVGNLGSLLVSAGADALRGLVNGIRGAIGSAAAAAAEAGRAVINGIKSTLKISSPSKVMIQIGRYVTQGLVQGLTGTSKQVQAASTKLANYVIDAFSDKKIKKGQRNSVLKTLAKNTGKLKDLADKAVKVASRLKDAQSNLAAAQKAYDDAFSSARDKVKDSFDIVSSGQDFVNLDLTKERFADAVAQAKQFAKDIATLAKRGLNKDLLTQLTDAGAAAGATMASALANASDADLKEFNSLQGQLNTAANSVGKSSADALYKAGVQAAQGIVNGLKSQQKSIDKQMDSIANSMVKAIKKALKIKSPSRAMFQLGRFISQGLANGIASLQDEVKSAAQSLATSAIAPTVALGAQQAVKTTTAAVTTAQPTAQAPVILNQTVNSLQGQSAKQVADYSFTKLSLALSTGVGSVGLPAPAVSGE